MTNKTGIGGWDVLTWESGVNKPRIRPKSVRFDAEVAGISQRNIINSQDQKPIHITYQGGTTHLYYDGAGDRIKKVKGTETAIYVGGIYEVRNGQAMSHVYANGQKIVTLTNNKEYYTHSDHLGSTSIVTDETGTIVEEIGYLPFGATLFRNEYNGSTWESAYRFTGQEFDPEYQLYNYNARLYDPIMSRFISADTIVQEPFNPQFLNRYTYCLNNPLIYVDPSGHLLITDYLNNHNTTGSNDDAAIALYYLIQYQGEIDRRNGIFQLQMYWSFTNAQKDAQMLWGWHIGTVTSQLYDDYGNALENSYTYKDYIPNGFWAPAYGGSGGGVAHTAEIAAPKITWDEEPHAIGDPLYERIEIKIDGRAKAFVNYTAYQIAQVYVGCKVKYLKGLNVIWPSLDISYTKTTYLVQTYQAGINYYEQYPDGSRIPFGVSPIPNEFVDAYLTIKEEKIVLE